MAADSSGKPDAAEVTRLLRQLNDGDEAAFHRLLPIVYESLKRVARSQLRSNEASLCTTELVHEAYLKLARGQGRRWEGGKHFYTLAAKAMRQVLVDMARKRRTVKRGGDRIETTLTSGDVAFEPTLDHMIDLDLALDRLDGLRSRLRQVVEYRFFAGLTEDEIAEMLGVSTRTIERDWTKARMFLMRELYSEPPP